MSILDVFANGMGCVLMLMVVFVLRLTVTNSGGSGEKARPMMVTVAWSESAPPKGAGPALLRMRVRRADGYTDGTADDFPEDWQVVEPVGAAYGDSGGDGERRRSLVALVPELPRNTRWELQLKLELGTPPIRQSVDKTHPYERLVSRITELWRKVDGESSESAREELLAATSDYLTFLDLIAEFQGQWLQQEEIWETSPSGIDRFTVIQKRWSMAADLYQKAKSLSYPSESDGKSSISISEFERELTRQIRAELVVADAADGKSVQLKDSSAAKWVAGVEGLLSDNLSLPMSVTFVGGVGAEPIIDQACLFNSPLSDARQDGWTALAALEVDGRGRVNWKWEAVSPVETSAGITSAKPIPTHKNIKLSAWDKLAHSFDSTHDDRSVLESVDLALRHLAAQQKPDGHFAPVGGSGKPEGPGVTGLCLLAFLARGHAPDVPASEYHAVTVAATKTLVAEVSQKNGNYGKGNPDVYHHGFAVIALANVLPRLRQASKLEGQQNLKELETKCEAALVKGVELLLHSQNNVPKVSQGAGGGWGYTPQRDDTSVAAVQVKALRDSYYAVPDDVRNRITGALVKAGEFFSAAHQQHGSYKYTNASPKPPSKEASQSLSIGDLPPRLPGSLLAECYCHKEYFDSGKNTRSTWQIGVTRLKQWFPSANEVKDDPQTHYAMYYAAQLAYALRLPQQADSTEATWFASMNDRATWFQELNEVLMSGQHDTGSYSGDTYGTAMAVIAILLPLEKSFEQKWP